MRQQWKDRKILVPMNLPSVGESGTVNRVREELAWWLDQEWQGNRDSPSRQWGWDLNMKRNQPCEQQQKSILCSESCKVQRPEKEIHWKNNDEKRGLMTKGLLASWREVKWGQERRRPGMCVLFWEQGKTFQQGRGPGRFFVGVMQSTEQFWE